MEKTKKEPKIATIRKGSLISVEALEGILAVSKPTIKGWIERHEIPRVKIGYTWVVDTDDIAEAIKRSASR